MMAQKLPNITSAQVEVEEFSTRMLVGSRARQYRLDVQEQFECTFNADVNRGSIMCWCAPRLVPALRQQLVDHRNQLLRDELNEVEEDLLAGHTRPVYGRGGALAMILFPGELLSVNIIDLPKDTAEAEVKRTLERYGPVRTLNTSTMAQSGNLFCQATFMKKDDAKMALEDYGKTCKDLVKVVPGKVQPGQRAPAETGYLTLTWDCPAYVKGGDQSETGELMLSIAAIRQFVPLVDSQPEMQTFFREVWVDGAAVVQAGIQVIYTGGIDQVQKAFKEWRQPQIRQMGSMGAPPEILQSLRCEITYQAIVSVHKAVAEYFNVQCPYGKSCRHSDCSKWHEGRRIACKNGVKCTGWKGANQCKFLHPYAWYAAEPPAEQDNPLLQACHNCTARGAKLSITTKGQNTSFRIKHARLEQLQAVRAELLEALMCEVFMHPHKDLLFTKPGVAKMQSVGKCLHWDKHLRAVRIFGAPGDRQRTKERLAGFCRELQTLEKHCLVLDRNKTQEWGTELETIMKSLQLEYNINKKSCQMEYWVNKDQDADKLRTLQGVLAAKHWERQRAPQISEGTCSLCMCEFDSDTYQFQACRHRFCTACLRNAFSDPDGAHFPIRCPYASETGRCDQLVVWKDIVGMVGPEALARIRHIAIDAYVRENPTDAVYCPNPACNHILQPYVAGDERQAGGSHTAFCEVCNTGYCLACSEDAKLPVPKHPGQSCAEARRAGNPDIKKHRDAISQILTLKCPRCKRAFLDYTGCAALTCDGCGCGFCAKCLKDCGHDAHAHAKQCRGPGLPGVQQVCDGYYLKQEDFDRLNLQVARLKVLDYLDEKVPPHLRRDVVKACEADFRGRPGGDLHID